MKTFSFYAAAAAGIPLVSGHYIFEQMVKSDGEPYQAWSHVREHDQSFQPLKTPYESDALRCNTGAENHLGSAEVMQVNAGDSVGFYLNLQGPIQHPGPLMFYMSKAPGDDASSYVGDGDWFKIAQWGTNFPFEDKGTQWKSYNEKYFPVTIPSEVPDGQYLLRVEHIAIHGASEVNGAEHYISCAPIEVSGGGNGEPGPLVQFPGAYSAEDPGIHFNMWVPGNAVTEYTFPGPEVWPATDFPMTQTADDNRDQAPGSAGSGSSSSGGDAAASPADSGSDSGSDSNADVDPAEAAASADASASSSAAAAQASAPAAGPAAGAPTGYGAAPAPAPTTMVTSVKSQAPSNPATNYGASGSAPNNAAPTGGAPGFPAPGSAPASYPGSGSQPASGSQPSNFPAWGFSGQGASAPTEANAESASDSCSGKRHRR